MVLREDGDAVICIGQASHAWMSGQLARAWAGDDIHEALCLGAEQHDIGMAEWDLAPSLNEATGRPHSFMEMPLSTHLALWRGAPRKLAAQSRHAALVVSLHGTALYERRNLDKLDPDEATAVRVYLDGQRTLQRRLAEQLGVGEDQLRREQQLLWAWDWLSLALCLDWAPATLDGPVPLALDGDRVDPWPFARDAVELRCEGRRLEGRHATAGELQAALERAPLVDLRFTLRR
jgi:Protein of unknown function (DUF3891)